MRSLVSILRYGFGSVRRQGEKSVLTILGLSLAISSMVFVYTMGIYFQSDISSVYHFEVAQNNNIWVTPEKGFYINLTSRAIFANGTLPQSLLQEMNTLSDNGTFPAQTRVEGVVVGQIEVGQTDLVVYGSSSSPNGVAFLSTQAASTLNVRNGQSFTFHGLTFTASVGSSPIPRIIMIDLASAQEILNLRGSLSWLTLKSPLPRAIVTFLSSKLGFVPSDDPSMKHLSQTSTAPGIVYFLTGVLVRGEVLTFDTKFSSLLVSQVVTSAFGSLGQITLILGFVLIVSTSILTLEERRKEMGVLASIGVITDIIYEFLAEFVIIFAIAMAIGVSLGAALDYFLIPQLFSLQKLVGGLEVIAGFFPPMIIFGALIPSNVVLTKRPVQLMRAE